MDLRLLSLDLDLSSDRLRDRLLLLKVLSGLEFLDGGLDDDDELSRIASGFLFIF